MLDFGFHRPQKIWSGMELISKIGNGIDIDKILPIPTPSYTAVTVRKLEQRPEINSSSWVALHISCLFSHLDTSDVIIVAEFMDTICVWKSFGLIVYSLSLRKRLMRASCWVRRFAVAFQRDQKRSNCEGRSHGAVEHLAQGWGHHPRCPLWCHKGFGTFFLIFLTSDFLKVEQAMAFPLISAI